MEKKNQTGQKKEKLPTEREAARGTQKNESSVNGEGKGQERMGKTRMLWCGIKNRDGRGLDLVERDNDGRRSDCSTAP